MQLNNTLVLLQKAKLNASQAEPQATSSNINFWAPKSEKDVANCLSALSYNVTTTGRDIRFMPTATPTKNTQLLRDVNNSMRLRTVFEKWSKDARLYKTVNSNIVNQWVSGSSPYPGINPSPYGTLQETTDILNEMFKGQPMPNRSFKTCAVVGGGYHLRGKSLGSEIDAHEAVIRINEHKKLGYEKDVGVRTTFRMFQKHVLYGHFTQIARFIYLNKSLPNFTEYFAYGFDIDFWDLDWRTKFELLKGKQNMHKHYMGYYVDLDDPVIWPHKIDSRMLKGVKDKKLRFYKWKPGDHGSPPLPGILDSQPYDNTGEEVYYKVMSFCDRISLYGFTTMGHESNYSYYWGFDDPSNYSKPERLYHKEIHDARRADYAKVAKLVCLGIVRQGDAPTKLLSLYNE